MKVADLAQGKDNNFNLIRILAAYAVLIHHAFPLALGPKVVVPLEGSVGISAGAVAVDVFFITSGFLVTASLLARQSTVEFVWARVLRVFPALFVMLVLTVFGLGLFF
ncbi:MAG TPA: acyltransferase family protein, partial [Zoogloea sp.]|nr:acyltransferase family protein [Zoogloea sp.]HQE40709.1 acyltransferase family protein [Zoogloea sp.]